MSTPRATPQVFLLVALLAATALSRPVLPVDETRYTGVAWEMLLRADFLVPWQNGLPYSHKPPLLFWLMQAGWALFGVSDWWPRIVPALFAGGSLWLVARLARELWPDAERTERLAPWILCGCGLWVYFASAIMFDMMLSCFVLLGWLGLARAWRTGRAGGFVLFALGLGGGLMSKGPVALLHLLPVALLAPWWAREHPPRGSWWAVGVLAGVLGGALIVLAWAIPAGLAGGDAYRRAIFLGQTTGRMTESFAHRQPFWFYLPMLPAILSPWALWPGVYRAGRRIDWSGSGIRFVLAMGLVPLLGFSLISGKQMQYLLPEFAAFSLLAARALDGAGDAPPPRAMRAPAALFAILGLSILAVGDRLSTMAPGTNALLFARAAGLVAILTAAWLAWRVPADLDAQVRRLACALVVVATGVQLAAGEALRAGHDLRAVSGQLRALQDQGVPIANEDKYHGQFHFPGRLQRPIDVVARQEVASWLAAHPDGRVVVYFRDSPYAGPGVVEHTHRYRGQHLAIVRSGAPERPPSQETPEGPVHAALGPR